jgi:hypothetical protein
MENQNHEKRDAPDDPVFEPAEGMLETITFSVKPASGGVVIDFCGRDEMRETSVFALERSYVPPAPQNNTVADFCGRDEMRETSVFTIERVAAAAPKPAVPAPSPVPAAPKPAAPSAPVPDADVVDFCPPPRPNSFSDIELDDDDDRVGGMEQFKKIFGKLVSVLVPLAAVATAYYVYVTYFD